MLLLALSITGKSDIVCGRRALPRGGAAPYLCAAGKKRISRVPLFTPVLRDAALIKKSETVIAATLMKYGRKFFTSLNRRYSVRVLKNSRVISSSLSRWAQNAAKAITRRQPLKIALDIWCTLRREWNSVITTINTRIISYFCRRLIINDFVFYVPRLRIN